MRVIHNISNCKCFTYMLAFNLGGGAGLGGGFLGGRLSRWVLPPWLAGLGGRRGWWFLFVLYLRLLGIGCLPWEYKSRIWWQMSEEHKTRVWRSWNAGSEQCIITWKTRLLGLFFLYPNKYFGGEAESTLKCTLSNINAITLQQLHRHILYKLLPPAARRLLRRPLLNVKLTQPASEVHDCHCYDLWLPLKGQHCAEAGNTHNM